MENKNAINKSMKKTLLPILILILPILFSFSVIAGGNQTEYDGTEEGLQYSYTFNDSNLSSFSNASTLAWTLAANSVSINNTDPFNGNNAGGIGIRSHAIGENSFLGKTTGFGFVSGTPGFTLEVRWMFNNAFNSTCQQGATDYVIAGGRPIGTGAGDWVAYFACGGNVNSNDDQEAGFGGTAPKGSLVFKIWDGAGYTAVNTNCTYGAQGWPSDRYINISLVSNASRPTIICNGVENLTISRAYAGNIDFTQLKLFNGPAATPDNTANGSIGSLAVFSRAKTVREYGITPLAVPTTSVALDFINPTLVTNLSVNRNWAFVNISLTGNGTSSIDTVVFNSNGSNASTNGLLLSLPFDNTTADYSGRGNDAFGTFVNCSTNVKGKIAGACQFDGTVNSVLTISNPEGDLNFTNNSFTIMLWFKSDNIPVGTNYVIGKGSAGSPGANLSYGMFMDGTNGISFRTSNNGTGFTNSIGTGAVGANDTSWHHVAATYAFNGTDNNIAEVYFDGVRKGLSKSFKGPLFNSGRDLAIGATISGTGTGTIGRWQGFIDDVRIYKRNLSGIEINATRYNGMGRFNGTDVFFFNQTNIGDSNYSYYIWANLSNSNANQTVTRNLLIDTIYPTVSFISPTPNNSTYRTTTSIYGNTSTTDVNQISAFMNFNRSLILYLDLNNNTNDKSGYANSVTQSNGINCTINILGKFGGACQFDNQKNTYLTIPDSDVLDTQVMTIESWVYLYNQSNPQHGYGVISKGKDLTNDGVYEILTVANGSLNQVFFRTGNTNPTSFQKGDIDNNSWTHIAVTLSSSTKSIYLNGVLQGTQTVTGSVGTTTNNLRIGQRDIAALLGNPSAFNGIIDEVKIYNRVLNNAEINASFNAGIYRLEKNFTGLPDGNYSLYSYVTDIVGNTNQTENRTIFVDATAPSINFSLNNDANGTYSNRNWTFINFTEYTNGQVNTVVVNWKGTNISTQMLIGLWNFNNDTLDDSLKGNDATNNGANCSTSVQGRFSTACWFDGSNDHVNASLNVALSQYTNFTVSAWFKGDAFPSTWRQIVDTRAGNAITPVRLGVQNGQLVCRIETPVFGGSAVMIAPVAGTWYHAACVFDNSTGIMTAYLNGEARNTTTPTGFSSSTQFGIGYDPTFVGEVFAGYIDEVRLYNKALSPTEINATYASEFGRYPSGNSWFMNQTDIKPSGNHSFYVWMNDTVGFSNQTSNITVLLNQPTTISINFPPDLYALNKNITFNYSITDADGNSVTCSLMFNSSFQSTNASLTQGLSYNITGRVNGSENYFATINCSDGINMTNSSGLTVRYDTVSPVLNMLYPSVTNTTGNSSNLTLDISCSDNNLFEFFINVSNGTVDDYVRYYQLINTSSQQDSAKVNFTSEGRRYVFSECSDDHTKDELLEPYAAEKEEEENNLIINTTETDETKTLGKGEYEKLKSEGQITKASPNETNQIQFRFTDNVDKIQDFDTLQEKDRTSLWWNSTNVKNGTVYEYPFELVAKEGVTYRQNSSFLAHFITGDNWIVLDISNDPNAVYQIVKINSSVYNNIGYRVTIYTTEVLLNMSE